MQKQTRKISSIFLFFLLLPLSALFAQSAKVEYNSLAGTKDQLPFWLWANQLGQFDRTSSTIQNLSINAFHQQQIGDSNFSYKAGVDLDLLLADENDIRFTQLFAALSWKFLQLQVGAFPEDEVYAGLSTTNGNLATSRNARPHPRIRAGFNRFVPILDWFSIKGFYEEGLLNDNRYVEDTHLHYGALYLRFGNPETIQITAGIDQMVMWGGTHPEYGELPGWDSYFKYMTASAGGENALIFDQINSMGNSYGVYQVELNKNWEKLHATLYVSHPYEDHSGMEFVNFEDNLIGIHLDFKREQALFENLVLEYFHTKNQSGNFYFEDFNNGHSTNRGNDNYFNHGIYLSGVTFDKMAIGSPLFAPVFVEDGISKGFENNRFSGFHVGADGLFSEVLHWKGLLTYSNNFGLYNGLGGTTYDPSRRQTSVLFNLSWNPKKKKIGISGSLAFDRGSLYDNGNTTTRLGTMFSVFYRLN
ncbi:capsule assembly Wzi family protein [uncultured Draconibacterium sp.]|uniref:capsule assembly Wzi family protein n=1 Tax=uncultured Draconibacterium sp. TaxID=1573823 RepID=UPI0025F593A3|nr:capsule assembly Wzi family protein [uncultured Draconibacterium sp.]